MSVYASVVRLAGVLGLSISGILAALMPTHIVLGAAGLALSLLALAASHTTTYRALSPKPAQAAD